MEDFIEKHRRLQGIPGPGPKKPFLERALANSQNQDDFISQRRRHLLSPEPDDKPFVPVPPDWTGADLSHIELRGASLLNRRMISADLSRADLSRADLERSSLNLANFSRADLSRTNMQDVNATDADLSRADLSRANLNQATLVNSDLSQADLNLADLSGANLEGANLSRAKNLTQEQVDSAVGDSSTKLPAGITRPDAWPTATKLESSDN